MKWRLFRRPSDTHQEAELALSQAEERLANVQSRSSEVHELSETLRHYREHNHFAEMIRASMRRI